MEFGEHPQAWRPGKPDRMTNPPYRSPSHAGCAEAGSVGHNQSDVDRLRDSCNPRVRARGNSDWLGATGRSQKVYRFSASSTPRTELTTGGQSLARRRNCASSEGCAGYSRWRVRKPRGTTAAVWYGNCRYLDSPRLRQEADA